MELWGIDPDAIMPLAPGWYRLERFLLCYSAERSSITSEIHMRDMSLRLKKAVGITDDNSAPYRDIFISRSNSRRKLINENEILPVIKDFGFEVVHCEDLSFKEQIKLFSEAKIILGDHGSGMNNQIFSPPGAKTIELYNPERFHHCICITSNVMGHEHWHTFSKNVDNDFNSYVDTNKLKKLLGYVFGAPRAIESVY
jgi:capsular polysaccharide biosynthesis protein